MMISTRGRYALRVLVDLAENQKDDYVTLKEVANRQTISEKYLEIIVKDLVRAGILEGLRGKGGGYRLSRAPEDISVLAVLELTEGSIAPVSCLGEGARICERAATCRTLPMWEGLSRVVKEYLGRFTVRDLMRRDEDSLDYVI